MTRIFRNGVLVAACSMAAAALPASLASAQDRRPTQAQVDRNSGTLFGIRGGYDAAGKIWGYGAQIRFPIDWYLQFAPSAEVYTVANVTTVQGNVDFIALGRRGAFYMGGGVAVLKAPGVDAKYGVNVFPGIDFPGFLDTPLKPFVEARWTFSEGKSPFRAIVGLNYPFGAR